MSRDRRPQVEEIASLAEVKGILGALDEGPLLEIIALRPTMRDVEEAATWPSGDRDIFGLGEPLKGAAAEIVVVLTSTEEGDVSRSR